MLELDENNYNFEAKQEKLPVLIGVYAAGFPLADGFEPLAGQGSKKMKFCKLDPADQPNLADKLCGNGNPSLLLLQDGQITQRLRGNYDCPSLRRILDL